ncbi:Rossmann-like and DUF2520 domain-containing protein [Sphingobium sp. Ant17]|uniref:Rossmann-like and DUF2520 domain-containing protein n=1 Tax=Sphingobium sp. Ant17 TaxID=1461752 RepID=UPI0004499777|nr:DUF2520 domain-containing protein [Sphingobium sp. Ant17]EXS69913.1 hypothetical protein BF95_19825 [Sphingobium sp. Ant17]
MVSTSPYRRIGIIGTGRVASAIGCALAAHSNDPLLIWGRNPEKCAEAVAVIGRAQAAGDVAQIARDCDLIMLAVADDALAPLIAALAKAEPTDRPRFIFHVSGRSGAAILEPLRSATSMTAGIHPAMTFTGKPTSEVRHMINARFAVTGSTEQANAAAQKLVTLLGGIMVPIEEAQRALYHAALCHGANHLVTLIAGACQALAAAGVAEPTALLAPLVRAALDSSLDKGMAGLSGPLLRGDDETIAKHLTALCQQCPTLLPPYKAMALATLDELDRHNGAPRSTAACRTLLEE